MFCYTLEGDDNLYKIVDVIRKDNIETAIVLKIKKNFDRNLLMNYISGGCLKYVPLQKLKLVQMSTNISVT